MQRVAPDGISAPICSGPLCPVFSGHYLRSTGTVAITKPIRPHGVALRGANLSRSSVLFSGPFGRIFRALPPADFGSDDSQTLKALGKLADKMTAKADPEEPKDGPD